MVNRPSPRLFVAGLAFALGAGAFPAAGATAGEAPAGHATARFVVNHPEHPTTELTLGQRVAGELHGPEVHRFTFDLRRGQFAAVRVEQFGSDLVATLFDPAGVLIDINDGNGAGAVEVVTVFAATTGRFAIQLAVFDWTTASAPYTIEWRTRERAGRTAAQRADQLVSSWYDPDAPGAAVLVQRGRHTLYRRGIGLADVETGTPITRRTAFDLASVSKQFTGYAVARLVEQGALRLDDDVRRYLPELAEVPSPGPAITVQHLLEHTSGLRDWDGLFGLTGRRIEDGISLDEVVAMAARQRGLNFAPGAEQRYSNTGYALLAKVVERVTRQPFERWVAEHLFRPLGLTSCSAGAAPAAKPTPRASSYRGRVPAPQIVSRTPTVTVGSSSIACSVEDLARWLANYHEGMLASAPLPQPTGPAADYGFGNWFGTREGSRAWFGHKGLAAGFRTAVRTFPAERLSIVFLANDGDDTTYRRAALLEDLFLGFPPQPIEVPDGEFTAPVPPPPVPAAPYRGCYYSAEVGTTYHVVAAPGGLALEHAVNPPTPLQSEGGDDFRSPAWFLPALRFVRDEAGAVVAFRATLPDGASLEFQRCPAGADT